MTAVGFIVRRTLGEIARKRALEEFERLRTDETRVLDLAKRYGPVVVDNLGSWSSRLLADSDAAATARSLIASASDGELDATQLRASYAQRRADRLRADAAAAVRHLEACERAAADVESRIDDTLDELREATSRRADDLIEQATRQTEAAIEAAEDHLAETRQRAEAHLADVRRRSRVVADQIVTQAESRRSTVAATALADLDAARAAAAAITAKADAAAARAERLVSAIDVDATDTTDESSSGRRRAVTDLDTVRRRRSRADRSPGDLSELNRDALYRMAKDRNIAGRSGMSKTQLIAALSS